MGSVSCLPHTATAAATVTSGEQFAAAFEFSPIGMALLDLQSRGERVNHALCEMFGYRESELLGISPLEISHPDDIDEDRQLRELMLSGAFPNYQRNKRYLHRTGRVVWTHISCSLMHDEHGQPWRFLMQVQDITQRKLAEDGLRESQQRIAEQSRALARMNEELEQRIRQRTAELEESNEQLRTFAYSLAHDLRGPLASTDGFARQLELLLGDRLDARARHYLNRVRAGVQSMSDLTDALLSLANLSHEPLQQATVDLSALARQWFTAAQAREPLRRVRADIADTPRVQGDARLLAVLVGNLLDNAWKFSAPRAEACIAFRAEEDQAGAVFVVEDNGVGFDPQYADKLFMPFHRLHGANEFTGTGMGLAIVHRIAQRHGGRAWGEARPGEGATFRFRLPPAA